MNRPEILDKWNHRDFEYFTERPQYNKNGNKIFDDLEIIIEAVQKFLEYGCAHDMRIVQYDLYGTIGVLRNDRSVSYTFKLIFETEPHDEILPTDFYGELNFHEVAKWSTYETGEHLGYLDYVCLLISADHETDILNSITTSLIGSTLFCTLFPCNECAKAIINKGIKEVVYLNEPVVKDIYIASRRLMELSHITCRKLTDFNIHNVLNS